MPFGASRLPFLAKVASAGYGPRTSDSVPISVSGNTQISTSESKFGGSSVVFDGTGDYLTATPVSLGNDFTIEFWYLLPTTTVTYYLGSISDTSNQNGFNILALADNTFRIRKYQSGTAESLFTSSTCITDNTWQHFALVRTSGVMTLYVNGTSRGSANYNINISSSSNFNIGRDALTGSYVNGYIDEVRVSNVARYTSGFTPSTTAFTPDGATLLLIHGDGTNGSTNIKDDPPPPRTASTWTNGSFSTTTGKFSTALRKGGGTGQATISLPTGVTIDDNLVRTIEFWFKNDLIGVSNRSTKFVSSASISSAGYPNTSHLTLVIYSDGNLYLSHPGNSEYNFGNVGTGWHHMVWQYNGTGNFRCWLDGVHKISATHSISAFSSLNFAQTWAYSGDGVLSSQYAYIDEVRISSVNRYTHSATGFTPPTTAFTNDADTLALFHMESTTQSDDVS